MVPANKILTVAYGTFSCTLEGFDDPFSTMTDIAEYFRDLAADDRFFGAEPPTPDMAMLRMIAETRAKHAVTAQPADNGVTLRPTEMPAAAAMSAAFDATEAAPSQEHALAEDMVADWAADTTEDEDTPEADETLDEGEMDATEEQTAETPVEDIVEIEDIAPEADADETEVEAAKIDDSVAAKLARIRGVVESDRQASSIYAEDEHADDMITDDADMAEDTLAAAFEADALEDEMSEDIDVAEAAQITTESEDTLAADLAAILPQETDPAEVEFVVETSEEVEITVTDEDMADEEEITVAGSTTDDAEGDVEAAADDADAPDEEASAPRAERRIRVRKVRRVQAAAEAAAAAAAETVETAADEQIAEDDAPEITADFQETDESITTVADAGEFADAEEEDAIGDLNDPAPDEDEDELMAELAAIEAELTRDATVATQPETAEMESEEADQDDDLMAELAAIRAEDAPDEVSETEEDDDDIVGGILGHDEADEVSDETFEVATAEEGSTDEVDEDVEETEAVAKDDDAPIDEAEAEVAEDASDAEQATVPPAPDMERLFAATDSRLSGEDTSRRHANISHLKAAVAARRADGPVEAKEVTETDAYRADLASTVRPRRKVPSADEAPRTPRPERPAPLVLVSEQRVEEPREANAAPVQPRRAPRTAEIEMQEEALSGAEDFEAFAADVGASDLSDILEAAAVYSSRIMGQDNFSRPRLLHLAAEAVEDMSREDGLRGFGQLLRDGTIRKVSRGTFALATESRYADEADRRAG